MQFDLTQEGIVTFTAEAGETDQSNAEAIAQAMFELSTSDDYDSGPKHFGQLTLAKYFQPRRGALSTTCLSIKRFSSCQMNLHLLYGREGELILMTSDLTMPDGAVPYLAVRARDLAVCTASRRELSVNFFRGQILRRRLECYAIKPAVGEKDWGLRRRAFREMITADVPYAIPAMEYLYGRFSHELDEMTLVRIAMFGAAIVAAPSAKRIAKLADDLLGDVKVDPLIQVDPRVN